MGVQGLGPRLGKGAGGAGRGGGETERRVWCTSSGSCLFNSRVGMSRERLDKRALFRGEALPRGLSGGVSLSCPFCPPGTRVSSPPGGLRVATLKSGLSPMTVLLQPGLSPLHTFCVWCPPGNPQTPRSPFPLCRRRQGGSAKRTELPKVIRGEKAELDWNPGLQGHQGTFQGYEEADTPVKVLPFGPGRWVLSFLKNLAADAPSEWSWAQGVCQEPPRGGAGGG